METMTLLIAFMYFSGPAVQSQDSPKYLEDITSTENVEACKADLKYSPTKQHIPADDISPLLKRLENVNLNHSI